MINLLKEKRFDFVSDENKKFISEFTKEMDLFGYDFTIKKLPGKRGNES